MDAGEEVGCKLHQREAGRQRARSRAEDTAARQGEKPILSSEAEAFKWPALIRQQVHVTTSHLIR